MRYPPMCLYQRRCHPGIRLSRGNERNQRVDPTRSVSIIHQTTRLHKCKQNLAPTEDVAKPIPILETTTIKTTQILLRPKGLQQATGIVE